MQRSKHICAKCFVPSCKNTTTNSPKKVFVMVSEKVKLKWCRQLNIQYNASRRMYCCEDHLNFEEDLENYQYWKMMKARPILKPTAKLRLTRSGTKAKDNTGGDPVAVPSTSGSCASCDSGEPSSAMSENETEAYIECRACLTTLTPVNCRNIFQPWCAPWARLGGTIAHDLARVTNIEISSTDQHPYMCEPCCLELHKACLFIDNVQKNSEILKQRTKVSHDGSGNILLECDSEKLWPKPIQLEKSLNGDVFRGSVEVEIKQEVLSDEDCTNFGPRSKVTSDIDIKEESLENVPPPAKATAKSIAQANLRNGSEVYEQEEYLEHPLKGGWSDEEQAGDLSLDCMLCAKSFLSLSGLKAHVIAHHSYKGVKRKASSDPSPEKRPNSHVCATCRRAFSTPTDLMVHETCHNKTVCYGCTLKFDSFDQLRKHMRRCKAAKAHKPRTRTLQDVIRPPPKTTLKCTSCDETFSDVYYMNIHNEIHHNSQAKSDQTNIATEETKRQNEDDKNLDETKDGKEFENELLKHLLGHDNIENLSETMVNENISESKEGSSAIVKMDVEQNNEHESKDNSEHRDGEQNSVNNESNNLENRPKETSFITEFNNDIEKGEEKMEVENTVDQLILDHTNKETLIEHRASDDQTEKNDVNKDISSNNQSDINNLHEEMPVTNLAVVANQPKEITGTYTEGVEVDMRMEEIKDKLHQIEDTHHDVIKEDQRRVIQEDASHTEATDNHGAYSVTVEVDMDLEENSHQDSHIISDSHCHVMKNDQPEDIREKTSHKEVPENHGTYIEGIEVHIEQDMQIEEIKDKVVYQDLDRIKDTQSNDVIEDTSHREIPDKQITEILVDVKVEGTQEIISKGEEKCDEVDVSHFRDRDEAICENTVDTVQKIEIELLPTLLEDDM